MSGNSYSASSTPYWTRLWTAVYELCDRDAFNIYVYGSMLVSMAAFWIPCLLLMLVDVTGRPNCLMKYKVQPGKNVPLSREKLARAVRVALSNQILVGVPFSLVVYYIFRWRGSSFHPQDLVTWQQGLLELLVFVAFEELGFYYFHRMFHHPVLYRHVHKQHHEWTAPVGLVALYAHPLEHVVANLLPVVSGPVVLGSHLCMVWLWFTLATVATVIAHSGYHFPFLPSPQFHDFHHHRFDTNYGSLGILDRLHGTDALFRSSKARLRHRMLFSLTPASQLIPD